MTIWSLAFLIFACWCICSFAVGFFQLAAESLNAAAGSAGGDTNLADDLEFSGGQMFRCRTLIALSPSTSALLADTTAFAPRR